MFNCQNSDRVNSFVNSQCKNSAWWGYRGGGCTAHTHCWNHFTVQTSAATQCISNQKQNKKKSLCRTVVQTWPISWNRLEVFSTVWERQASTLHGKQSAMHSNKLINSQLSSPLPLSKLQRLPHSQILFFESTRRNMCGAEKMNWDEERK